MRRNRWLKAVHEVLHNICAGIEVAGESLVQLLPETRTSNPLSKLLRPVMEHKRIRAIFGANLAGAMILVGSVSTASIEGMNQEPELVALPENQVVIATEERFQLPVELIGVSQGYGRFHPGVDMRASLKSQVLAVSKGTVKETEKSRWGYGHQVVVEHPGNLTSRYAHLDQIEVKVGDEVGLDTVIGTIGLTGWTSGPHLHLEIYQDGKAINPLSVVPLK